MPTYSGVWSLPAQYQAKANLQWPQGPGAPTSVVATAGDTQATITFVAPTFTGIPPGITGYLATSTPGGFTATGASSPLTVTGLSNGTAYTFAVQATNSVGYGPAGTSGSVTPAVTPYGVFAGGNGSTEYSATVDYVVISTLGNATNFGNLSAGLQRLAGCGSATRGVYGGGLNSSVVAVNTIQYITFTSAGNTTDFGDLFQSRYSLGGCNSSTRGVFAGGRTLSPSTANLNTIDYITIASTGDASDFGDLAAVTYTLAGCSSSTRGVFGGGQDTFATNVISYVTIASTGNATDFGDLRQTKNELASCSSATRGLFFGGPGDNTIDYITIASTGNAVDFGGFYTASAYNNAAACSSSTRGVYGGGGNFTNIIQYVTIATTGNTADFGDLTAARRWLAACSNTNGGVQ